MTFRSRLLKLLQKTRKAVRLYSSIESNSIDVALRERGFDDAGVEYRPLQVEEWRKATQNLLRDLSTALEQPNSRRLTVDIFALRDRFHADWRLAESEMHSLHRDIQLAVETADYIKVAQLGKVLVRLKSRVQASQAAHHEIQDVIDKSKVSEPQAITLESSSIVSEAVSNGGDISSRDSDDMYGASSSNTIAKVIPLRRKRVLGGI